MRLKFNSPFNLTTWGGIILKYAFIGLLIFAVLWTLGEAIAERQSPQRRAEALAVQIERQQATEDFRECLKHSKTAELREGCITTYVESKPR